MCNEIHDASETDERPPTVIVAEKEPLARAALAYLLSYDGYRVFQVENLNSAISQINNLEPVSVLLADLDMPGWRSIVRHAAKTTSAFVIGMEGNHPFSEMYDLKEYGISVCLRKPLVYEQVRKAILDHLRTAVLSARAQTTHDLGSDCWARGHAITG